MICNCITHMCRERESVPRIHQNVSLRSGNERFSLSSFHHQYFPNFYNKLAAFTIRKRSLLFLKSIHFIYLASRKTYDTLLRGPLLPSTHCFSFFQQDTFITIFHFYYPVFLVRGFTPSITLACSEDDVYLPSEILLREYIMMDYGFVHKGHERFITSWPWNYGQVTLPREIGLTKAANKTQVVRCWANFPSGEGGKEGKGDAFPSYLLIFYYEQLKT